MRSAVRPTGPRCRRQHPLRLPHHRGGGPLQIFDRHGGRVFATTDPGRGWDGRLRGQLLPQGVYTWRLAYTDAGGEAVRETGSVVLLR